MSLLLCFCFAQAPSVPRLCDEVVRERLPTVVFQCLQRTSPVDRRTSLQRRILFRSSFDSLPPSTTVPVRRGLLQLNTARLQLPSPGCGCSCTDFCDASCFLVALQFHNALNLVHLVGLQFVKVLRLVGPGPRWCCPLREAHSSTSHRLLRAAKCGKKRRCDNCGRLRLERSVDGTERVRRYSTLCPVQILTPVAANFDPCGYNC